MTPNPFRVNTVYLAIILALDKGDIPIARR
jgi:hypothetical protein